MLKTASTETLESKWKQLRGEIQSRWGELTDDRLDQIAGNYQKLVGALQEKYRYTKERAEKEVGELIDSSS